MLEQTWELAGEALCRELKAAMTTQPVTKPASHRGGRETDMFVLRLSAACRREAVRAVELAHASGRMTSATAARGLGGFVEAWREYADWDEDIKTSEGDADE